MLLPGVLLSTHDAVKDTAPDKVLLPRYTVTITSFCLGRIAEQSLGTLM